MISQKIGARWDLLGLTLATLTLAMPTWAASDSQTAGAAAAQKGNAYQAGTGPASAKPAMPGPAAANPLVLQGGEATQSPERQNGRDHESQRMYLQAASASAKPLPLFGYSFFQPARDIIEARRASLKRQYELQNQQVNAAGGQQSTAAGTPGTGTTAVQNGAPASTSVPGSLFDGSSGTQQTGSNGNLTSGTGQDQTVPTAPQPTPLESNPATGDAYHQVSDPFTQLSQNVPASVPQNYELSSGDVLTIRYWTPTRPTKELTGTVDSRGSVMIPEIGQLTVRGLTAQQAENVLRERLRRLYKNADATLSLRELRTMTVTMGGEAYVPGSYVVPAISTVFNVLYAAGGPTDDGSLRAIEVRRNGRLIGSFDFYSFLRSGGNARDITLEPGDLIYIPPRLSRVSVRGEVRQPAIFELKPSETLRDALRFAGGVKASGVDQRVQINTFDPGNAHVLRDVNLKNASAVSKASIYDGDEIEVFSVRDTLANRVTIEGAVDQPGDYALLPGMHVADLLNRARGPLYSAYSTRADLYRWNADNTQTLVPIDLDKAMAHDSDNDVELKRWDRLKIYSREEVAWIGKREATVRGAVQRPGVYSRSENLHVRDLLLMAGGPTPEAYLHRAALLHQHGDGTYSYDYVDITQAMAGQTADDLPIQDNDILAIYRTGEAQFTPDHTVTVQGEVVAPGIYPRGDGMKLSDVLKLSGGFKPGAGTRVAVAHARRSVDDSVKDQATVTTVFDAQGTPQASDDTVLQDNDVITVQGTGGFLSKVPIVMVKGAVNRPGPIALMGKMRLSDVIREAGGLRPEAFPAGAEFTRDASTMATPTQRNLASVINSLNDLLNQTDYKRELAKSDLDRMQAANSAVAGGAAISTLGLGGTTTPPPTSAASAALAGQYSQHELVQSARLLNANDLQPNGFVAVNLAEAIHHPRSSEDIMLMDGDTLTVPEQPTTVQIVGAVYSASGVLYKPGAPLEYYVAQAGGYSPDAAKDRIEIIHAGGGVIPASKSRIPQPGDLILVPTKVLAAKLSGNGNNLNSLLSSLTNSAVIYKVITSLVK